MNQGELFPKDRGTPTENRKIVREAIDRVTRHTSDDWKEFALEVLYRICLIERVVVTDDLWKHLDLIRLNSPKRLMNGPVPEPEPNHSVAGYLMLEGARRGWLENTGDVQRSDRKVAHRKFQCEWRSVIYDEKRAQKYHA